jgi:hypothetical protein
MKMINLNKLNFKLIIGVLIIIIQSCNFMKTEVNEVKFKPDIQSIADKYKSKLEAEEFQTSSGWIYFNKVTTHLVIVTILNSKNLPDSENELENIALHIAGDVFSQMINKEDFSNIEVIFQSQKGTLIKIKEKSKYQFSYEEIEKHMEHNQNKAI